MPILLGVDPGVSGGLAIIAGSPGKPPRIIDCIKVPVDTTGRVDVLEVISFIQQNPPDLAIVERASAMPSIATGKGAERRGMGATSAFNFGAAVFTVRTCIVGLGIKLVQVEAQAWKKAHGLSSKDPATGLKLEQREVKELSRQKALRLFRNGERYFPLIGDHNKAESALIAAYGAMLV